MDIVFSHVIILPLDAFTIFLLFAGTRNWAAKTIWLAAQYGSWL
jgi:hypothetical protein